MNSNIDVTYGGQIKALKNLVPMKMEVNYTVEGKSGKTTTTSFLIDKENFIMVTFDYQELKKLIEGEKEMKDGLTKVKELKDKIHEQYIEIQELKKRAEDLKTINEEHQILNGMLRKENDRLNNIINELKKYIKDTKQDGYKLVWINEYKNYFEAGIEEILGSDDNE